MSYFYENENEDKSAIGLMNKIDIQSFEELESVFKNNSLPLRERYMFYYIGKQHARNTKEQDLWGTDNCKYRFYGLKSNWWEKYLKFNDTIKLKIRNDLYPDLPKIPLLELLNIDEIEELHPIFIKKGWKYKEQMDIHLMASMDIDIEDPNADWDSLGGLAPRKINDEIKEMENLYDSYISSFTEVKNRSLHVKTDRYCPACQENPCMCSDPF